MAIKAYPTYIIIIYIYMYIQFGLQSVIGIYRVTYTNGQVLTLPSDIVASQANMHAHVRNYRRSKHRRGWAYVPPHVSGMSTCLRLHSEFEMATKRMITSSETQPKRRQTTVATFRKWQTQHEKEYQMLSWLRCDRKSLVQSLWCALCKKYKEKIRTAKNFISVWFNNQKIHWTMHEAGSKTVMTQLRAKQAKATNTPL